MICEVCERMEHSLDGRRTWCGACGCPKTKWSTLEYKNSKEGWHCPLGKF